MSERKSIKSRRDEICQEIRSLRATLDTLEQRCLIKREKYIPREACFWWARASMKRLESLVRGLTIAEGIQSKKEVGG